MSVVRGPWRTPVKQPYPSSPDRWWARGPAGELIVILQYSVPVIAPVLEAELGRNSNHTVYEQPDTWPNAKRITQALDIRGMIGPEVDEALGVFDPVVDFWESGYMVPTKAEIRRLATLTEFPVAFFYREDSPEVERMFICELDQ